MTGLSAIRPALLGPYWRTARHLRPGQIISRLLPRSSRRTPVLDPRRLRPVAAPLPSPPRRRPVFGNGAGVTLLNRSAAIAADWDPPGLPRLWRYHLHYLDDLDSPDYGAWVSRWIAANPPGRGTGWEPYPLSRRIPNWIAWLLTRPEAAGQSLPAAMAASLAAQTRSLEAQLEHHLLGNHLLANWRALVFAHCFFDSPDIQRVARQWSEELDRQLLPDGGHQERSPMYHALILNDLLDLIALEVSYPGLLPVEHWRQRASAMLGWLAQMTHPDGGIAFFQDAAFDMAPEPVQIQAYATRLGVRPPTAPMCGSGYVRLATADGGPPSVAWLDVGSPSPAHQPGHAHAGALSLELSHRGARFLVNSGTSTYEPGPVRTWERSTAAHNTLRLDGRDQSEMWAAFRVGRRARTRLEASGPSHAEAWHDGYAPSVHRRRVRLEPGWLTIEDELQGQGEHLVELFFHLHPDVRVEAGLWCRHPDGAAIRLHLPVWREPTVSIEPTLWSPEFGRQVPNQTIVCAHRARLPITLLTRIELS